MRGTGPPAKNKANMLGRIVFLLGIFGSLSKYSSQPASHFLRHSGDSPGIVNINVDPQSSSLVTNISPPISLTISLLIVVPRPVPPYFLVTEPSAWENGLNSFFF